MEGGSTITQQLVKQTLLQAATTAEERAGGHRGQRRPQAPRGPPGAGPGAAVLEVGDPHPLPEPRLLRPGRLRHPGRRPARTSASTPPTSRCRRPPCSPAWCRRRPTTTRSATRSGARERRNQVLQRMLALGHITAASSSPTIAPSRSPSRPSAPPAERLRRRRPSAAFFCDYLQRYLTQTLGITPGDAGGRRARPSGRRCAPTCRPRATRRC